MTWRRHSGDTYRLVHRAMRLHPFPTCMHAGWFISSKSPSSALGRQKHPSPASGLLAAQPCDCDGLYKADDDPRIVPIASRTGGRAAGGASYSAAASARRSTNRCSYGAHWCIELQRGHHPAPQQRSGGSCLSTALLQDPSARHAGQGIQNVDQRYAQRSGCHQHRVAAGVPPSAASVRHVFPAFWLKSHNR